MVPALEAALSAGTAHLPTAEVALSALEAWHAADTDLLEAAGDDPAAGDPAAGGASGDAAPGAGGGAPGAVPSLAEGAFPACGAVGVGGEPDSPGSGADNLEAHLPKLLPLLDAYLFDAKASNGPSQGGGGRGARGGGARSGGGRGGGGEGLDGAVAFEALQRRLVVFLGRLAGGSRHVALPAADALRASLRGQEAAPRGALTLKVPFPRPLRPSPQAAASCSSSRPARGDYSLAGPSQVVLETSDLLPRLAELCTGQVGTVVYR